MINIFYKVYWLSILLLPAFAGYDAGADHLRLFERETLMNVIFLMYTKYPEMTFFFLMFVNITVHLFLDSYLM